MTSGGSIFVDLRDRYGIAQAVIDMSQFPALEGKGASTIRLEDIMKITGTVQASRREVDEREARDG